MQDRADGPTPVARPRNPWSLVLLVTTLSVLSALAAAAAGFILLNPVGGDAPELVPWGTGLWVLSAMLHVAGFAARPGPVRGQRVLIAVVGMLGLVVAAIPEADIFASTTDVACG